VSGQWYVGDDLCSSKKEAEQSAAKKACEALLARNVYSSSSSISSSLEQLTISTSDAPPSYSEVVNTDSSYRFPSKYADIEQFIATKVGADGGRIRKTSPPDSQGRYKFEITGSYRYCENIRRHHKKNQIFFIVDPVRKTYIQKCHDSECYGFQSALKYIDNEHRTNSNSPENDSMSKCSKCRKTVKNANQNECERCGQEFCGNCLYECDLCHDAPHCERCIDSCVECHDS
jgi:hypothetical protein